MRKSMAILFMILSTFVFSSFTGVKPDNFFLNTCFTVSAIVFSVGLSLIVTFNLTGVKNRDYIKKIRDNIHNMRNKFISYFFMVVIIYLLGNYMNINDIKIISISGFDIMFNLSTFFCMMIILSVAYFIVNFLEIQKFNEDIFDRVNNELSENENKKIFKGNHLST